MNHHITAFNAVAFFSITFAICDTCVSQVQPQATIESIDKQLSALESSTSPRDHEIMVHLLSDLKKIDSSMDGRFGKHREPIAIAKTRLLLRLYSVACRRVTRANGVDMETPLPFGRETHVSALISELSESGEFDGPLRSGVDLSELTDDPEILRRYYQAKTLDAEQSQQAFVNVKIEQLCQKLPLRHIFPMTRLHFAIETPKGKLLLKKMIEEEIPDEGIRRALSKQLDGFDVLYVVQLNGAIIEKPVNENKTP